YETRKEYILRDLRGKLPWHSSVVKFITLMCNDVIDLRKKSTAECCAILKSHELDCIDDLLKLPFSSITLENITRHKQELEKLEKRIAMIEKMYPHEFWMEDLGFIKV
ncbi:hypothetical protein EB118_04795, partial [bacterium]|nr:hypothetical protein [bacterium]